MPSRFPSRAWALVAALSYVLVPVLPAQAFPLTFSCIADGGSKNCAAGEAQLQIEVDAADDGQVVFVFTNDGPASSAIARVYVEDNRGTLSNSPRIVNEPPDVVFDFGVNPKNLPGASTSNVGFIAIPEMSVTAITPQRLMGVNPGEHLGLIYTLSPGRTAADVVADLTVGYLRFGVHVVGFASGAGESFVSRVLVAEAAP